MAPITRRFFSGPGAGSTSERGDDAEREADADDDDVVTTVGATEATGLRCRGPTGKAEEGETEGVQVEAPGVKGRFS